MSAENRLVIFKESFLNDLSRFENFLGRNNPVQGRLFSSRLLDFCYDVIAPFPLAYPIFEQAQVRDETVRRAVYRRDYILLYRVREQALRFVALYHTREDISGLQVPE